jgi:hypothetical protein
VLPHGPAREPHRALFASPVVTVDRLLTEGVMSDRITALMKELAQARAQMAERVAEIARLRLRKPAAEEEHSQARHETSEPR